jgi:redox-sensing transcriptional repressor
MNTAGKTAVSRKTVGRLSLYRRLLDDLRASGVENIYSHQLAHLAGVSAAQVRRDFMVIGYSGSPNRGYQVDTCMASIESLLNGSVSQEVALVGLGRLGQSLLAHFAGKREQLRVTAGFDTDPALIGTSFQECPIYSVDDMEQVVADKGIRIAILAVPPDKGQEVAEVLVRAGIRSFVDFTGIPLRVPDEVFVDHMDITSALESAAFFARREQAEESAEGTEEGGAAEQIEGAQPAMFPIIRTIDSLLAGADMTLRELAQKIGATVATSGQGGDRRITKIYAGDRVSDLLNEASGETLLVTNLVNLQMVRMADLMEVPGICFVDGVELGPDLIELADKDGIYLMVSPLGVFETCGHIYQLLAHGQPDERAQ